MPPVIKEGIPLKKGQIIRVYNLDDDDKARIFEVEEDVKWNADFNIWGSVRLVGYYPPIFTHKGGIEVITDVKSSKSI